MNPSETRDEKTSAQLVAEELRRPESARRRLVAGVAGLSIIVATLFSVAGSFAIVLGWAILVAVFGVDLVFPEPTQRWYPRIRNLIVAAAGLLTLGRALYLLVGSQWATLAGTAIMAMVFVLVMYMVVTGQRRRSGR